MLRLAWIAMPVCTGESTSTTQVLCQVDDAGAVMPLDMAGVVLREVSQAVDGVCVSRVMALRTSPESPLPSAVGRTA